MHTIQLNITVLQPHICDTFEAQIHGVNAKIYNQYILPKCGIFLNHQMLTLKSPFIIMLTSKSVKHNSLTSSPAYMYDYYMNV